MVAIKIIMNKTWKLWMNQMNVIESEQEIKIWNDLNEYKITKINKEQKNSKIIRE